MLLGGDFVLLVRGRHYVCFWVFVSKCFFFLILYALFSFELCCNSIFGIKLIMLRSRALLFILILSTYYCIVIHTFFFICFSFHTCLDVFFKCFKKDRYILVKIDCLFLQLLR